MLSVLALMLKVGNRTKNFQLKHSNSVYQTECFYQQARKHEAFLIRCNSSVPNCRTFWFVYCSVCTKDQRTKMLLLFQSQNRCCLFSKTLEKYVEFADRFCCLTHFMFGSSVTLIKKVFIETTHIIHCWNLVLIRQESLEEYIKSWLHW